MQFVVFAGQSNALGFGMSPATLPAHLAGFNFGQTYIWGNDIPYWGVLTPGVNTGTAANPQAWGPEVEFAYQFRLSHPDEILLIVKSAKGSTSLAVHNDLDWSPSSDGELFDLTADRIAAAKAALGLATSPTALFWMQGEDDALVASEAQAYGANLAAFATAARAEWLHDPAGYIGLGRISDSPALPHSFDVRLAQWEVDQVDGHLESFKTIGFAMQPDGVHYAADGHVAIGKAFFDNWVA